mmetsp:Transcript_14912/g.37515  ORF Transcript_14912/g.37515 Transcript_14912/m.37515 type:complete len:225 (-) Transcript_14912:189-863(-)
MSVRAGRFAGSARRLSSVAFGKCSLTAFANASFVGANTVRLPDMTASTRFAAFTSVSSVESSGVATTASTMLVHSSFFSSSVVVAPLVDEEESSVGATAAGSVGATAADPSIMLGMLMFIMFIMGLTVMFTMSMMGAMAPMVMFTIMSIMGVVLSSPRRWRRPKCARLRQLPIQLKGLAKPRSGMPLQHGDHAHVNETVSAPRLHRGQQQFGRNPPPGDHGVDG